jgi:hypothetical protein
MTSCFIRAKIGAASARPPCLIDEFGGERLAELKTARLASRSNVADGPTGYPAAFAFAALRWLSSATTLRFR